MVAGELQEPSEYPAARSDLGGADYGLEATAGLNEDLRGQVARNVTDLEQLKSEVEHYRIQLGLDADVSQAVESDARPARQPARDVERLRKSRGLDLDL